MIPSGLIYSVIHRASLGDGSSAYATAGSGSVLEGKIVATVPSGG